MIAESLQKYGPARSISIDEGNKVLAGNGVVEASMQIGIEHVRVYDRETGQLEPEPPNGAPYIFATRRSNLTPDEKTLFSIADNRTGDLSTFAPDVLQSFMDDGLDLEQFWFPDELAGLLAGDDEPLPGLTDPDSVPDVPDDPITKPGDVWMLGEHRVCCGDSTVVTDVDRLMQRRKADMVFTDPPYGVAYQTKLSKEDAVASRRRTDGLEISNDALTREGTKAMLLDVFGLFPSVVKPGGTFYICSPSGDMETIFRSAIDDSALTLRQVIAWVKDVFVMGRQDYHWRHETILYGWLDGAAHYFVDDRTQSTVWEIDRPKRSQEHPTMKPIALVERAINNSCKPQDLVLDLFGGSGSTLIAAEQTGRTAYLMELDPKYCDVIVTRWEQFTGQTATRETQQLPEMASHSHMSNEHPHVVV